MDIIKEGIYIIKQLHLRVNSVSIINYRSTVRANSFLEKALVNYRSSSNGYSGLGMIDQTIVFTVVSLFNVCVKSVVGSTGKVAAWECTMEL